MIIAESPQTYTHTTVQRMTDFDIGDYLDADGHRTDQIPDRRNVLIIDGHAYQPAPRYPLDAAWRRGA